MIRAALLFALFSLPAEATCRLGLILALDVSSSVDAKEYKLQSHGLAAALRNQDIVNAFLAIPGQSVAFHVFEWSGTRQQIRIVNWSNVTSRADLERLARIIETHQRSTNQYPTAMGYALGFAASEITKAPACDRYVLDVSGDGENNHGFPPHMAYANFDFRNATTNGLVVGQEQEVIRYFYDHVIRGPGAFVETAESYRDYANAIRRKLLRELLPLEVSTTVPRPIASIRR